MLPDFDIGFISVPSYGLCAVLGACAALICAAWRNRYGTVSTKDYFLIILFSLIGLFIGARLLYVVSRIPAMIADFDIRRFFMTFLTGGIVYFGGLIGALGAAYLYIRTAKCDIHKCFNLFAPCIPLFHVFGRIGCFLGGCCYGTVCSWGVLFQTAPDAPRLPVQLFEAAAELIIFIVLLLVEKKRGDKARLTELYLILYAPVRFALEFFRGDELRGLFGALSTSQYVSIIIIAAVIIYELYIVPKRRSTEKADSGEV